MAVQGFLTDEATGRWYMHKHPASVIRAGFDWSDWLNGDAIESSEWAVSPSDGSLVVSNGGIDGDETSVQLTGGVQYETYRVTNTITTDAGRVETWTFDVIGKAP